MLYSTPRLINYMHKLILFYFVLFFYRSAYLLKKEKGGEMAETAVSIVIQHVLPLLVQEVRLRNGFQSKVTSIKGQLEIIQSFLKDADIRAEK